MDKNLTLTTCKLLILLSLEIAEKIILDWRLASAELLNLCNPGPLCRS